MTTDRTRTAPATYSRGAFLGAAALTLVGGGTGIAAMTSGSASAGATARTVGSASGTGVTLPSGWSHTIFDAAPDSSANGYLSSFSPLYGKGAITRLSAAELRQADGIANFLPYDTVSETEEFTPVVSDAAVLDGDAVHVAFRGSKGSRHEGTVRLVRTADSKTRALILFVRGQKPTERNVPNGAPLVSDSARIASPRQLTDDHVRTTLTNAVGLSFSEDGPAPKATVDRIRILDGGQHVTARIRGTSNGTHIDSTWYGTAVHGNDKDRWSYVFGKLPA